MLFRSPALHSACLMQLEFHQLDRCWEHLRVRHAARQRRLLASLFTGVTPGRLFQMATSLSAGHWAASSANSCSLLKPSNGVAVVDKL